MSAGKLNCLTAEPSDATSFDFDTDSGVMIFHEFPQPQFQKRFEVLVRDPEENLVEIYAQEIREPVAEGRHHSYADKLSIEKFSGNYIIFSEHKIRTGVCEKLNQ
ncbi:MAG: hypothetical protein AAFV59_13880 [Pseudomonadota bacterium]